MHGDIFKCHLNVRILDFSMVTCLQIVSSPPTHICIGSNLHEAYMKKHLESRSILTNVLRNLVFIWMLSFIMHLNYLWHQQIPYLVMQRRLYYFQKCPLELSLNIACNNNFHLYIYICVVLNNWKYCCVIVKNKYSHDLHSLYMNVTERTNGCCTIGEV